MTLPSVHGSEQLLQSPMWSGTETVSSKFAICSLSVVWKRTRLLNFRRVLAIATGNEGIPGRSPASGLIDRVPTRSEVYVRSGPYFKLLIADQHTVTLPSVPSPQARIMDTTFLLNVFRLGDTPLVQPVRDLCGVFNLRAHSTHWSPPSHLHATMSPVHNGKGMSLNYANPKSRQPLIASPEFTSFTDVFSPNSVRLAPLLIGNSW
jgi:hypothetical protein